MNKQGVYRILNLVNGKFYIGSSVDIKTRWYRHKSDLRRSKHTNNHLQSSWNKHSEENFLFEIVEYINDHRNILDVEQMYIDILRPEYNMAKHTKSPMLGRYQSEETKRKIGNSCRAIWTPEMKAKHSAKLKSFWTPEMRKKQAGRMIGYKHTPKTRTKMSALWTLDMRAKQSKTQIKLWSQDRKEERSAALSGEKNGNAKLNWNRVRLIRRLYKNGWNRADLGRKFNVSWSAIDRVVNYLAWKE